MPSDKGGGCNSSDIPTRNHRIGSGGEFDEQLTPYLRLSKPPTAAELVLAERGIGAGAVELRDGIVSCGSSRAPESRTAGGHRRAAQAVVFGGRPKYLATAA